MLLVLQVEEALDRGLHALMLRYKVIRCSFQQLEAGILLQRAMKTIENSC